ncbi:MAG TPA: RtcB family protein [Actinomycetota bacterium]|nr:RtcB family protein [Actinomycetota bacterium]
MELIEDGEDRWRIPRHGGMLVDGLVFTSKKLIVKAKEDRALEQVANVAHLPGIVGESMAMPDIHWGYGFPIGGVAATDVEAGGVVSPGGVGFDIGCGVRLLRSSLGWDEVSGPFPALIDAVAAAVPRGVGGKGLRHLSHEDVDRVLVEGARWAVERGIGTERDLECCEDGGALEGADPSAVSDKAKSRGAPQLGSLGAGNHFIEVQVVDEVFDEPAAQAMELFAGQVCVMIHTGSRGIGHQTCTDEVAALDQASRRLGLILPDRQLACAPVKSPEAQRYLGAMAAAANYARANRQVLAEGVRGAFQRVLSASPAALGLDLVYDVSHNIAKLEDFTVGGRLRTLCVHRKGATRAFGPGNPELPLRYQEVGQPVIIPGSMGSASFVLAGRSESAEISFSSTCHGAGRLMSRKQATMRMSGQDLQRQLAKQGILVRAQQMRLLAEEAPYAYKDASEVVRVCQRVGMSRVVARLRPVGVVKG